MDKPLSCDLHDYLEIICMFHYQVKVTIKEGLQYEGEAKDVGRDQRKEECLILINEEQNIFIPTNQLKSIDVLTTGARFSHVDF